MIAHIGHDSNHGDIGSFTTDEITFLEEIFFSDARQYGFFGERTTHDIETVVPRRDVQKTGSTGHNLLRGPSLAKYAQLREDLKSNVVLTSGIRGVMKHISALLG